MEKDLSKAQPKEALRLVDPEAQFIRMSQLGGWGSATPTWARRTLTLGTWHGFSLDLQVSGPRDCRDVSCLEQRVSLPLK